MSGVSAEKMQKFRQAVEGTKKNHEEEHELRLARNEQLRGALARIDGQDAVFRNFSAQERLGLMARCNMWNTSKFEPVRVLGEGAFGVVHLVKDVDTNEYRALKQMDKDRCIKKNSRDAAYAERDVLAKNRSAWFVEMYATFQDRDNIYTVMEFLQGGDLIGRLITLGRLSEDETRFYMAELLEALDTVHRAGYVHRDVKPDNMVFSSTGHLKLLDFGLCRFCPIACAQARWEGIASIAEGTSHVDLALPDNTCSNTLITSFDLDPHQVLLAEIKVAVTEHFDVDANNVRVLMTRNSPESFSELYDDGKTLAALGVLGPGPHRLIVCQRKVENQRENSLAGTPQYMPPEVWRGVDHGPEGDIWALGIITFECLVGHVPFHSGRMEGDGWIRIVRDKILQHRKTLEAELNNAKGKGFISEASEEFLRGVLIDRKCRRKAEQCRRSPFFDGIDFSSLQETDPPFVPDVEGPDDTRFFEEATARELPPTDFHSLRDPGLEFAGYDNDMDALEAAARSTVNVSSLLLQRRGDEED